MELQLMLRKIKENIEDCYMNNAIMLGVPEDIKSIISRGQINNKKLEEALEIIKNILRSNEDTKKPIKIPLVHPKDLIIQNINLLNLSEKEKKEYWTTEKIDELLRNYSMALLGEVQLCKRINIKGDKIN